MADRIITSISIAGIVPADPFAIGNPLCPECGDPYIGGRCYAGQCMSTCGWCEPGKCDGETCTPPEDGTDG